MDIKEGLVTELAAMEKEQLLKKAGYAYASGQGEVRGSSATDHL
jgi:hypothetical protein